MKGVQKTKYLSVLFFGITLGLFITACIDKTPKSFAQDEPTKKSNIISQKSSIKGIDLVHALNQQLSSIGKRALPTIVSISTEKNITVNQYDPFFDFPFEDFFGFGNGFNHRHTPRKKTFKQQGLGSGIIISKDGYILTNNHVIGDADKIQVTVYKNGEKDKTFDAKIIGKDPSSDVGLIKIDPKGYDLKVAKLGDSDKLNVGEMVIAIGAPLGLAQSFTTGVVSALHRQISLNLYENFIQTDAAINPGNSGGALLNIDGEVIGINTAIMSKSGGYQGIGFAIPINMAQNIVEQLKDNGEVKRGWLGISMQSLTDDVKKAFNIDKSVNGVLVADVFDDSPAKEAGVKRGDIITKFDGKNIDNMNTLKNLVGSKAPNSKVEIEIYRDNKPITLKVKLAKREEQVFTTSSNGEDLESKKLGLTVSNTKNNKGVIIKDIKDGSSADNAGFRKGDIILQINKTDINNIEDFKKAIKKLKKDKAVPFLIKRGNFTMFIITKL